MSIPEGIPKHVLDYAPLVYLSSKERYFPSSITAQIENTRPQISFKDVTIPSAPLTLANLDQLNGVGSNGGNDVYLNSTVDIATNPRWLEGVKPDASGVIHDIKTCVVIVVDKGNGVTDAFYFYFNAFNWGGVVLQKQLGDHVGDWEHNMIRFENGVPKAIWCSQHANGEAFKFDVLRKSADGKRPIVYCANGSHAIYTTPGLHDHTIPNLNLPLPFLLVDETDAGPLYDPLHSSYYYTYNVSNNTLTPYSTSDPVGYLYYKGRWGDEQYPDSDKRQQQLVGNRKYVGGPTGPLDKQLNRKDVWPQNAFSNGQKLRGHLDFWIGRVKGFVAVKKAQIGSNADGKKRLVTGETVK